MSHFLSQDFPLFRPAGAASSTASERLTRLCINALVPSLLEFRRAVVDESERFEALPRVGDWLSSPSDERLSEMLATSFELEGSDKARHGYHVLYGRILSNLLDPVIFEVGLGSNNPDVPSNMGPNGSPGASLRAFTQAVDGARVAGGDVDTSALCGHDFETHELDQLDMTKFPLRVAVGAVDLLIDDGLHMPVSNINTVAWGVSLISDKGVIVVEDIPDASLPVWQLVHELLPARFASGIFEGTSENAFVVSKRERFDELFRAPS